MRVMAMNFKWILFLSNQSTGEKHQAPDCLPELTGRYLLACPFSESTTFWGFQHYGGI